MYVNDGNAVQSQGFLQGYNKITWIVIALQVKFTIRLETLIMCISYAWLQIHDERKITVHCTLYVYCEGEVTSLLVHSTLN